jgi:hypothetical protein
MDKEGHAGERRYGMTVAAAILVAVLAFLTAAVVIGMFLWAAVKDGEEDKAVQRRLGIRRRSRLGR